MSTAPGGAQAGSALVGERCRVFWPNDEEWYEAVVAGFEPVTARHSLKYTSDADVRPPPPFCSTAVYKTGTCARGCIEDWHGRARRSRTAHAR